ncbi:hypothetical protein AC1031_003618 [Aphanomyces cochlioides]|nr:hypothetical protein AC1031_003618 [Aphanomyces cochlioides]
MTAPQTPRRDDSQCTYPYKTCTNPRAIKRDGSLHTLCVYHRDRGNRSQQQYYEKRSRQTRARRREQVLQRQRAQAEQNNAQLTQDIPSSSTDDPSSSDTEWINPLRSTESAELTLSEIEIFCSFMLDSDG